MAAGVMAYRLRLILPMVALPTAMFRGDWSVGFAESFALALIFGCYASRFRFVSSDRLEQRPRPQRCY